jgi:hypothetical protein
MNPTAPVITESSVNSLSYPGGSTVDQLSNPLGVTNLTGSECVDTDTSKYGTDNSGLPLSGPYNCLGYLGDPGGGNPATFNPDLWPCRDGQHEGDNGDCLAASSLGTHAPDHNNGLIDIRVSGTFPIEDDGEAVTNSQFFGSIDGPSTTGGPPVVTLPAEWPKLAALMADSSTNGSSPGSDPNLWDIHGGPTNPDTHPEYVSTGSPAIPCPADTFSAVFTTATVTQLTDAVNNCLGSDLYFSRVFGDVTSGETAPGSGNFGAGNEPGPTVGPYDPEAPNETLLSDGRLNADDAPMPALPVTVSIAPNAGGTDLGGVGGLYAADKELIYSHNFDADAATLGNLYNPFYYEYIPATARGYNESSGVNGIAGDDFPGFDLLPKQPYKFWNVLKASSNNTDTNTVCLRRNDQKDGRGNSNNDPGSGGPEYYPEPNDYQADSVLVYTDERGEAFVTYNPGDGFYLNNLIKPTPISTPPGGTNPNGLVTLGDNGVCDLQPYYGKEIGYSSITATAQYPYQGVDYPPVPTSNTLVKNVTSLWNKTLTAYPSSTGAPGDASQTSDFVTTANDINGQPFAYEEVCFSVQGVPSGAFTGDISTFGNIVENTDGAIVADTINDKYISGQGTNVYCVESNDLGEAGVQVSGSVTGVDVTATFVDEGGLTRDVDATLGSGVVSDGTPPVGATVIQQGSPVATTGNSGAGASNSSNGSGSSSGSTGSSPVVVNVAPLGQHAKTANVYRVEGLRLVRGKHGYAVSFKLSGAKATVSITIRVYRANGKLLRTYRMHVRANKVVSVNVGSKVAHVTVTA